MQTINRLFLCFLLFFVCVHWCYAADEIHLTSGDYLVGDVKEINHEYVVIDTSFAKDLLIKHELISRLKTEQAIAIVFKDSKVVYSPIEKVENSKLNYQISNNEKIFSVNELANNPKEILAATSSKNSKLKYKGNFDVGLSRSSGNEDDEDYHAALMAQARTQKNRYTIELAKTIEKNDGDKTQDETFGSFQYDRFINEKWYAFSSVSFEEDFEEQLDLRSTFALGSGYQFYDLKNLKLNIEAGLAYVDEDFDDDEDNQYTGGRWAIHYDHAWLTWLALFHSQEGFFSMENSDDITIRSSSGFKFPLNEYINAKLQANIDWNRSPADGATGTDKEYIFTLGYEF